MNKSYAYSDEQQLIYLIFFSFCFQFTDLKIGFVKISEILLLIILPFVLTRRINFFVYTFFLFFSFLLIKTLLLNPLYEFYINADLALLKQPYFVSVARFVEITCCIIFAHLTYLFFDRLPYKKSVDIIKRLIAIQIFYIGLPLLLIFVICKIGIISFVSVFPIVYNTEAGYGFLLRLAGFYVEGGPFGLFLAFIYILFDSYNTRRSIKNYVGKGILITLIVYCAQSKAGITLLAIWFLTKFSIYFSSLKNSKRLFIYILLPILMISFGALFYKVSKMYRETYSMISDPKYSLYFRNSTDGSTVMGRVAGAIIIPNMLKEHPVAGIGLGNYPLMRNSPLYRSSLPAINVSYWDAHGFGGIVDILVEGGIIFLIVFIYLISLLFKKVKKSFLLFLPLFVCFIGPFICGVQIHFLYPWFAVGCLISFIKKYEEADYEDDQLLD